MAAIPNINDLVSFLILISTSSILRLIRVIDVNVCSIYFAISLPSFMYINFEYFLWLVIISLVIFFRSFPILYYISRSVINACTYNLCSFFFILSSLVDHSVFSHFRGFV